MRLAPLLVTGIALGSMAAIARAQAAPPTAGSPFEIPHEKYVLDNGMEVILHPDTSTPMVAVNLWYHTGPVNEPPERSGFAHLFEHLMFEGSKHAGDQFDYLLESVGGTNMNGTTSWDRTNYFETVPAQHLELALWLEADRMGFMIDTLTEEQLDVQREVVKNERRESYENQPYGPSSLVLYDTLFPPGHPYHGAIIGSMEDLSKATLDDVRAFFETYYAPANATLTLAGHFEPAVAKRLIDKHFASLPARGQGRALVPLEVSTRTGPAPARVTVEEDVSLQQLTMAWHAPPAFSVDEPALEVATRILGSGKASRLYQALVASGLSNGTSASLDSNQLGSIVTLQARASSGSSLERLESVLLGELQRLMQEGPADDELARAKNGIVLDYASQLQSLNTHGGEGGRAGLLQRFNHYRRDPGGLAQWLDSHQRVDAQQIRAVLAKYLRPEQAVVVLTVNQRPPVPPEVPRPSTEPTAAQRVSPTPPSPPQPDDRARKGDAGNTSSAGNTSGAGDTGRAGDGEAQGVQR